MPTIYRISEVFLSVHPESVLWQLELVAFILRFLSVGSVNSADAYETHVPATTSNGAYGMQAQAESCPVMENMLHESSGRNGAGHCAPAHSYRILLNTLQ